MSKPAPRVASVRWRALAALTVLLAPGPLAAQAGLTRDEVWPLLRPAVDMAGYRMRKRLRIYEPEDWLVKLMRSRQRGRVKDSGLTIHQLAKEAGVPLAFAKEAEQAGLLRADRDRGCRWPKYRVKLAGWLVKLARLRADGLTWPEISDWSKRRWQTGEIAFPGKH